MKFAQTLQTIEECMTEDYRRCLDIICSDFFVQRLFKQQLRMFSEMFERVFEKKGLQINTKNHGNKSLRTEVVLACYSIVIMRQKAIRIGHDDFSTIGTKSIQLNNSVYSSKKARDILLKILIKLPENDSKKNIIAGLLLKVRGFKDYNLIVSNLHPEYISENILNGHIDDLKKDCPHLLEKQLLKYKDKWYRYLKDKPICLAKMSQLILNFHYVKDQALSNQDNSLLQINQQQAYIINRLKLIETSNDIQTIDIEDIISNLSGIYAEVTLRINETASNDKRQKSEEVISEYSYAQVRHRIYIQLLVNLLNIINALIHSVGLNWIRRIKWLYNFIMTIFTNLNIKNNHFHESIALEYSQIVNLMIQIWTSYLVIFKNGLFPVDRLHNFVFNEEHSFYKLVEALLYNEYPFDEQQVIRYQNYQKQKRTENQKSKQAVINMVNFSMKSLNINPMWDGILTKIIPNLKNSISFGKRIINSCLFFFIKYFQITQNFESSAKLILMIVNGKNSIFINDKQNKQLIKRIKAIIYPERGETKEGLQFFCEEYFSQYIKTNKKRKEEEMTQKGKIDKLSFTKEIDMSMILQNNRAVASNIERIEQKDMVMEGWDHFQSVKKNSADDIKSSSFKQSALINGEIVNNEIFYSVHEGGERQLQSHIQQSRLEIKSAEEEDNILLPDF